MSGITPIRRLYGAAVDNPLAAVVASVLLYSTGPVLVRAAEASGVTFAFWRLWIGVGGLGVALLLQRIGRNIVADKGLDDLETLNVSRAGLLLTALAGTAFGAHQLMVFSALKLTTVADVTLISSLTPIVVGLMAVPLFGERPGPGFRMGAAAAIVGSLIVVVAGSVGDIGEPRGMALALGNVVFFSIFFVISKQSRSHLGVLPFLIGTMLIAAVFVSIYSALTDEVVMVVTNRDIVLCAVVALGPGLIGHALMTWSLQFVPANIPPVMRLSQPVLASLFAWAWLGERVAEAHVAGGALMLVGITAALRSGDGQKLFNMR